MGGSELDLHWLYEQVQERGGIAEVVSLRRWPEVVKLMTLPKTCTNAGFSLKLIYQKYLMDYERVNRWGMPDIPPKSRWGSAMPMPAYSCENVALPDPCPDVVQGEETGGSSGSSSTRKRHRTEEGESGVASGAAAYNSSGPPAALIEYVVQVGEEDEEDDRMVEYGDTASRVAAALRGGEAAQVDWALNVLTVQSHARLPVFKHDRTILPSLAMLLQKALVEKHEENPLLLLNVVACGAFSGSLRRQRVVAVLVNALANEESVRSMAACSELVSTLIATLQVRRSEEDGSLETRRREWVVLEAALAKGAPLQGAGEAAALLSVLGRELWSRDLRRPLALALLARLVRGADSSLPLVRPLLEPGLLRDVATLLGDAMLVQGAAGAGSEEALLQLESALDFFYHCSHDAPVLAPLVASTPLLVHRLVMFLLE